MGMKPIRYAVVGLGHIAQVAVLPAFKHAEENSELTALVSDDPAKLKKLGGKYNVKSLYSYDQYGGCLTSGEVDAVYIALPNNLHAEFTEKAARAGVHVLCEKPLAVTEEECRRMMAATEAAGVKLMTAYRLHFEEATLEAIDLVQSGKLGRPRFFESSFSMQVEEGDIRLRKELGGGTLHDIGVYCINAARMLFQAEPECVMAFTANSGEKRFREVDEMSTVLMRFPNERLAQFTCSFGAADVSSYRIVGTQGDLRMEPAYEYAEPLQRTLTAGGKSKIKRYKKRDQFAPELIYFSDCILRNRLPEPSGMEGLADVQIIQAILRSAETGQPVTLEHAEKGQRPTMAQKIVKAPTAKPETVHADR